MWASSTSATPANPLPAGTLPLPGEPTSVAVAGPYALVGVNTSADFINVSGELAVVHIASQTLVHSIDLGGQPDSVAVSPDGSFAAVVIENDRDEDLNNGDLPQAPAGKLVVVSLTGAPTDWTTTDVDMTGLPVTEPTDPEPEFVDINSENMAVVQENNGVALVDMTSASVVNAFSAGTVDLDQIDATEEDALISQTESLSDIPREPDGVAWIPDLAAPGGLIPEKIEGLAVTRHGQVWIVNDNDGVDDNSGETELLNLGHLF